MEFHGFLVGEAVDGLPTKATYDHLLDLVQVAERDGIDGWFFAEHHCDAAFSTVPAPNLLVAQAAQATTRLRLGVMVTVLPYHHPLRAAEEIRMLDVLSDGRLEIGLGRGAIRHEQAAYGIDRDRTAEMFDAGLDILLRLLTESDVEYENEWWRGSVPRVVPDAVQRPYPPLWMAAVSESSIERAARVGANCAVALLPLELARERRAQYRDAWQRHHGDRAPGKFSFNVTIAIGETRADAERHARGPLFARAERFLKQISDRPAPGADPAYREHERGWRDFVDSSFDELIDHGMVIYGSVDDAVEQLARIAEAGFETITFVPQFPELDYGFARRSLELFAREVVPRVTGGASSPAVPAAR
jgi:alkanesulfonate monooxygenase SsuD/methylene tetrahydromethanopterin reductase-like flavin-dependent oxidoreductase (luciferase family)